MLIMLQCITRLNLMSENIANFGDSASNLRVSSSTIIISPESQTGQLILTNVHTKYSLLFKIKTKIEKVFEVKPTKGFLRPGEKAVVAFKTMNRLDEEEKSKYEKNLQFLLQGVNVKSSEISRQQEEAIWKSVKEKKADISIGYCAAKLGVAMSGGSEKPFMVPFSTYESKIDGRFSSSIKSEKKDLSSFNQLNQRFGAEVKQMSENDSGLSERYVSLKREHSQLEKQREKIFAVGGTGKGSNGNAIKYILLFVAFFFIGNLLKGLLDPPPEPVKPHQNWFMSLFS